MSRVTIKTLYKCKLPLPLAPLLPLNPWLRSQHRASPSTPFGQYQIIVLHDKCTSVNNLSRVTTVKRLGVNQGRELWILSHIDNRILLSRHRIHGPLLRKKCPQFHENKIWHALRRFWHATLKIASRHTSTSSSTEGGSEPNLLLRGE